MVYDIKFVACWSVSKITEDDYLINLSYCADDSNNPDSVGLNVRCWQEIAIIKG